MSDVYNANNLLVHASLSRFFEPVVEIAANPMNAPRYSSPAPRATRLRETLERFANGLAVLLGAMSLVATIAFWVWYAFGPKPVYIAPMQVDSPTAVLRATLLFGSAPTVAPSEKPEAVVLDGDLRLLGVIADDEGQGYAVFRVGQGVYIAQVGDDLAGRATLMEIEPNAVVLRDLSGTQQRVILRREEKGEDASATKTGSASIPATASGTPSTASSRRNTCVPTGFRGAVVRLNTELLQGALNQPETFYALLEAKEGGLVVRADSGHAAMLGLRAGDVLQSANGIALTRAEDVSATMLRPLTSGQTVLLKGKRGEQTRELLLVNVSMCQG